MAKLNYYCCFSRMLFETRLEMSDCDVDVPSRMSLKKPYNVFTAIRHKSVDLILHDSISFCLTIFISISWKKKLNRIQNTLKYSQ